MRPRKRCSIPCAATAKEELAGKAASDAVRQDVRETGIKIIAANSPQAYGRVERAHRTHQDRLVKKLRGAGVSSYKAANRYVEEHYLSDHNAGFARQPSSEADFHRKRPGKLELDEVFQLEQERVVIADWVVNCEGRSLQLERQSRRHAPAKSRVTVRENQAGDLAIEYRGRTLGLQQIPHRPARHHCVSAPRGRHTTQPPTTPGNSPTVQLLNHQPRGHFYSAQTGDISNEL